MNTAQMRALNYLLSRNLQHPVTDFHHGDCVGSDAQAHELARTWPAYRIHLHPPKNNRYRAHCEGAHITHLAEDYIVRNHHIVDQTDFLIATPDTLLEQARSGTWATVRYAESIGKRLHIILPTGTVVTEVPRVGFI